MRNATWPPPGAGAPPHVARGRSQKPPDRVLLSPGGEQVVRVCVTQPGPPRLLSRRLQVRPLQGEHRSIELSEVAPCSGSHYPQLDRLVRAELPSLWTPRDLQGALRPRGGGGSLWTPRDLQGALRPSQRSFAVSQHRQPPRISAQPSRSPQL